MMRHQSFLAALLLVGLIPMTSAAQSAGVVWEKNLDAARKKAEAEGKLLLLHFWTETCGPCKRLDSTVFNQPSVASSINKHFVPLKVNANAAAELAKALRVTRVPTDVIVTTKGKVVQSLVSPATPMDYIAKMTQVAAAEGAKAGSTFALAAAKSPYGPIVNQTYANLTPPQSATSTADVPSIALPPAGTPAEPKTAVKPTAPSTSTPAPRPQTKTNPYLSAKPKPKQPVAKANGGPQLPPGAPPLAFDGYCTVTMKKGMKWARGDARYGAIHRGRTYLFTSPAEQKAFLSDPDSFAPALSGVDPVVAFEQGKAVAGKREFGLEYEDRFYLFSSEATLNKFWSNPSGYAERVQQAMASGAPSVR